MASMTAAALQEHALTYAIGILSTDTDEHGPANTSCHQCARFWEQALDTEATEGTTEAIERLVAAIPAAGHPKTTCAACDGCRFELANAMTTIALAKAGVDENLAWGPGHADPDNHPADWRACPTCTEWTIERARARQACLDAGVDADRWLGTSDTPPTPTWP